MADQKKALEVPKVDGFKIYAKLKGGVKDVEYKLRPISFLEIVPEKDCVNAAYIESRDIDKNPYIFALFKFKADSIEVLYTIPPNIAPKKRKFDMVRYFLNLLTSLSTIYVVDPAAIYQLLDAAMKEMTDYVSLDYNRLYTAYDHIKKDYEDMQRRLKRMQQEIEVMNRETYEIKTKNDELAARLKQLEVMSDDALKEKVQEWLFEHSGEINIGEFSKVYSIPEQRVEEILNALMKEGYIQSLQ